MTSIPKETSPRPQKRSVSFARGKGNQKADPVRSRMDAIYDRFSKVAKIDLNAMQKRADSEAIEGKRSQPRISISELPELSEK